MAIARCTLDDVDDWLFLRRALWPDDSDALHREHMERVAADDAEHMVAFIAYAGDEPIGLAEARVQRDRFNGYEIAPVAILEGLYVVTPYRRRDTARALLAAVESWARTRYCTQLMADPIEKSAARPGTGERPMLFRKPLF